MLRHLHPWVERDHGCTIGRERRDGLDDGEPAVGGRRVAVAVDRHHPAWDAEVYQPAE